MNKIETRITEYINGQPEQKRSELNELHCVILEIFPGCKLWFLDGKNDQNKTISNPNIGYGQQTIHYAGGKTKSFYQIGLSANSVGISVYLLGIKDKTFLTRSFGDKLEKASISGYCIKFKTLKDIDLEVLKEAIRSGFEMKN